MYLHDDYCPDRATLEWLANADNWRPMAGKFHCWEGWWLQPPRNPWETKTQMIWQSQRVAEKIAGFE
ncbi:MAG: hypothetical protein WBN40_13390 [Pseudomonadales bacterium]